MQGESWYIRLNGLNVLHVPRPCSISPVNCSSNFDLKNSILGANKNLQRNERTSTEQVEQVNLQSSSWCLTNGWSRKQCLTTFSYLRIGKTVNWQFFLTVDQESDFCCVRKQEKKHEKVISYAQNLLRECTSIWLLTRFKEKLKTLCFSRFFLFWDEKSLEKYKASNILVDS